MKKTSSKGCKNGETRHTFIIDEAKFENVKAIAFWERKKIKEIMEELIDDFLSKKKDVLYKAIKLYLKNSKFINEDE